MEDEPKNKDHEGCGVPKVLGFWKGRVETERAVFSTTVYI